MADYTARTLTYRLIRPDNTRITGATITATLTTPTREKIVLGEDLPVLEQPWEISFTEDDADPGLYSANLIPNTGPLANTRYRITQYTGRDETVFYIVMPDHDVGPEETESVYDAAEVPELAQAPPGNVIARLYSFLRAALVGGTDVTVMPNDAAQQLALSIDTSGITIHGSTNIQDNTITKQELVPTLRTEVENTVNDVAVSGRDVTGSRTGGGSITGGTISPPSKTEVFEQIKAIFRSGTHTTFTSDDSQETAQVNAAAAGGGSASPADHLSQDEVDEAQAIVGVFDNAGWTIEGAVANRSWSATLPAPPAAEATSASYSSAYAATWSARQRFVVRLPDAERDNVAASGRWRVRFYDPTTEEQEIIGSPEWRSTQQTGGFTYYWVEVSGAGTGTISAQKYERPVLQVESAPSGLARTANLPQPSNAAPLAPAASASAGTNDEYSRRDHVHPEQAVPQPATADPRDPALAAAQGSSDRYARADHVHRQQAVPQPATATPASPGTAAIGSSNRYAREDHVHPADGLSSVMSDGFSVKGDGTSTDRLRATGLKSQAALPPIADAADGDRVIVDGVEYERVESAGARNVISGTLSALSGNRLGFDGLILGSRQAGDPASYLPTLQVLKSVVPQSSRPASVYVIVTNHTTRAVGQDVLTYTAASDTTARWGYAGGDIRIEAKSGDVVGVQVFQEDSGGKGAPLNVEAALAKWVPTGGSSQEQPTGGGSATVDQTSVYTPAKDIIQGGHGVDVVADDAAETLTLNASVPSGDELPDRSLWTVGYDFDLLQEDTITHDFCGPGTKHSPDTITFQFTGGPQNAPAFIISYSPEYSGSGSATVAGKTFVAIGGTYTMPSDAMLTAYFEGAARTQYPVTQARADATLPSWHEVPTLSYATLNRPGFRLCRNFSSASTSFEVYPSVSVPAGAKVFAGAGHGDAGWVNRPGVAAPWATQGQPEPRTLLALTTFIDGPGQGLNITNSSNDVTPAWNYFNYPTDANDPATIGMGDKFILGDGDGRLGTNNIEANLTIPPNTRSDQQIGFGAGGNDLTWRLAGWVTAQTGLAASVGVALADGNILDRVSVYRGSTRIGEVRLLQGRAADNQGGYRLVYDGIAGAYNLNITSNVEAFFVHNDGPAASTGGGAASPAVFEETTLSAAQPSLTPATEHDVMTTEAVTAAQAGHLLLVGNLNTTIAGGTAGGPGIIGIKRTTGAAGSRTTTKIIEREFYASNTAFGGSDAEIVCPYEAEAGDTFTLYFSAAVSNRTIRVNTAYTKLTMYRPAGGAAPAVSSRGPLWATSSVLTSLGGAWTNAASAPPDIPSGHTSTNPDWTVTADAPAEVIARNNASQYRLALPQEPPDDCCNGFWVTSEVGGVEVASVFLPWAPGLTIPVTPTNFQPHTRVPLNIGNRSTGGGERNFILASLQQSSGGAFQLRLRSAQDSAGTRFRDLAANTRIKVYPAGVYIVSA